MTDFINGGESREGDKAVGKRIYGPWVKGENDGWCLMAKGRRGRLELLAESGQDDPLHTICMRASYLVISSVLSPVTLRCTKSAVVQSVIARVDLRLPRKFAWHYGSFPRILRLHVESCRILGQRLPHLFSSDAATTNTIYDSVAHSFQASEYIT